MAPVAKIRARRPIEQTGFFDVPESVQVTVRRSKDVNKRKGNNVPGRSGPKRPKQQTCTKGSSQTCFVSETIGDEEVVASRTSSTTTRYQRESDKQASFQKAAELLPNEHREQFTLSQYTRNIAFQLQQRALRGLASTQPIIQTRPISWSLASWLKFQCPRSGTPLTGACIMEWDSIGVLLAIMASQDSILRIYDWDTVSASDVKGRNHRVRRKTNPDKNYPGGSFRIDGTFSLNVGICGVNVRKLIWNPFDPDQIAILDSNFLYLFDLGREAARQQSGRVSGGATPIKIELPLRRHTSVNLLFLAVDTMIVTAGEQVACITTRKSTQRTDGTIVPSVKWSMTWKNNTISSLIRMTSDLILLGSLDGNFSVVSSTRTQKVSFATVARPVVLNSWFSGKALLHPGSQYMGILHLAMEYESAVDQAFGDVRVTWVTSCGWSMAAVIDIKDAKPVNSSTILHRTAPVVCKNHRNEDVDLGKNGGWSLPAQKLCVTGTSNYLCWERVPSIVQILPDHDKFVVDNRPRRVVIPGQPTLYVLDRQTGHKDKLFLGKGTKHILALAMHTSHEWILVSTAEDGVRFYNSRRKIS